MMRIKRYRFVVVAGLMGAVFVCTPLGAQGQEAQNTNTVTVLLEGVSVSVEDVTHVFISQRQPDHTVNIALFPNAQLVDFWATYTGDLWEDHGDEYAIAPGIRVLRTPGHTEEDASLVGETAQGTLS